MIKWVVGQQKNSEKKEESAKEEEAAKEDADEEVEDASGMAVEEEEAANAESGPASEGVSINVLQVEDCCVFAVC